MELAEDAPALVGIDHGYSFPLRYFAVHRLKPDWSAFLDDFQRPLADRSEHLRRFRPRRHGGKWWSGKRFDWLSPSTKWDVTRDQLARNVEAVWSLAKVLGKDYRMLICHEHDLKHHEVSLLEGYRSGTWSAGWPHISVHRRREFSTRIGTVTWTEIAEEWPALNAFLEKTEVIE